MATRQTTIRFAERTDEQLEELSALFGDRTKVVTMAIDRLYRAEITERSEMMNPQVWVCSKCGRTVQKWTRGWLIDSHKDAEKSFHGEMVIRCPDCITDYAISQAEHGREAIR